MKILKGRQVKPRRVLLYGQEGVGKSTWAAMAPRPIFLDFEDGLGDIEVEKTERLTTFGDTLSALGWLYSAMAIGFLSSTVISGWTRKVNRHGVAVIVGAGCWGVAIEIGRAHV